MIKCHHIVVNAPKRSWKSPKMEVDLRIEAVIVKEMAETTRIE